MVPVSMVLYAVSTTSDTPAITRLINSYRALNEETEKRNTLHTAFLEQASRDRHLFNSSPRDTAGPDLQYPEYGALTELC